MRKCGLVLFFLFCLVFLAAADDVKPQAEVWQVRGAFAALMDDYPGVKYEAVKKLAELNIEDAIEQMGDEVALYVLEIAKILVDDSNDIYIRAFAVTTMGSLGKYSVPYISEIVKLLEYNPKYDMILPGSDWNLRVVAVEALGNLRDHSAQYISEIVELLTDENKLIRSNAVVALGNFGDDSDLIIRKITQLLTDDVSDVRLAAVETLGTLGKHSESVFSEMIKLLTDDDLDVRSAAVVALGKHAAPNIPEIIELLTDDDWTIRSAAVEILEKQRDHSSLYIQEIIKLFSDEDRSIHTFAIVVLVNMGGDPAPYISKIGASLSDPDFGMRLAAINALGNLGDHSVPYILAIVKLLSDNNSEVRSAAVKALGNLGDYSGPYISEIALLLADGNWRVQVAAVEVLGKMGGYSEPFIPEIIILLTDDGWNTRSAAVEALVNLGEHTEPFIQDIGQLLVTHDSATQSDVIEVLGNMGKHAKPFIPEIIKLLADDWGEHYIAAEALVNLGEYATPYIPEVIKILANDSKDVKLSAVKVLENCKDIELKHIASIINYIYNDTDNIGFYQFLAYYFGGGNKNIKLILSRTGKPLNRPDNLTIDEARKVLLTFNKTHGYTAEIPDFEKDLVDQMSRIICKMDLSWEKEDLPLLHDCYIYLADTTHAESVKKEIDKIDSIYRKIGGWAWKVIVVHLLFWLGLIFVYPHSPQVQAIFFWNPYVRKIAGLGYVNVLLTWVPFLRRKLFIPFRGVLIADAELDDFDPGMYYKDSMVLDVKAKNKLRLSDAIPKLAGRICLEGDSGLGKSLFLKFLLQDSRRLAVFLPAYKCVNGIITAIKEKLHGTAKDEAFLQNLIYSGTLDIYIDGVNEVSPNTRALIMKFVETNFHGRIILTTQPMEGFSLPSVTRYVLQPLLKGQIYDFLHNCGVSMQQECAQDEFDEVCRAYLDKALSDDNFSAINEKLLSNPMDLTFVAQLIAGGVEPDLFRLEEQNYKMMAVDYKIKNIDQDFPLDEFSQYAYELRLTDKRNIASDDFVKALLCMERFKMVLKRVGDGGSKEYYFRHDKIWEYFIAQVFRADEEVIGKHLDDPRFKGVYLLLVNLMSFEDAMLLREDVIEYSAETGDHMVSDAFVNLLKARAKARELGDG